MSWWTIFAVTVFAVAMVSAAVLWPVEDQIGTYEASAPKGGWQCNKTGEMCMCTEPNCWSPEDTARLEEITL
jgi:hypothetical protein